MATLPVRRCLTYLSLVLQVSKVGVGRAESSSSSLSEANVMRQLPARRLGYPGLHLGAPRLERSSCPKRPLQP